MGSEAVLTGQGNNTAPSWGKSDSECCPEPEGGVTSQRPLLSVRKVTGVEEGRQGKLGPEQAEASLGKGR